MVNSGTTGYTGLTLTDNLGSYTVGTSTFVPLDYVDGSLHYYIGGTEQAAPTVTAGPPMTVTGISVPAATFAQNAGNGEYTVTPGVAVLTVTGTV